MTAFTGTENGDGAVVTELGVLRAEREIRRVVLEPGRRDRDDLGYPAAMARWIASLQTAGRHEGADRHGR